MCSCSQIEYDNFVAHLRKNRGMSQSELAKRCDSTQQQISNIEAGKRKLTWDWMRRIAHALECHPMDLVRYDNIHHKKLDVNHKTR